MPNGASDGYRGRDEATPAGPVGAALADSFGARGVVFQLGVGAAVLLMGLLPVLAAFGLVETEGRIEPLGRLLAFVFGGVLMTLAAFILVTPFRAAARSHGAVTWRQAVTLGRRALRRRLDRRSAVAATGVGVIAAAYWSAAVGARPAWAAGRDELGAVLLIEFLVIHGFPFLTIAATFARTVTGRWRIVPAGALGLLLLLYGSFAWLLAGGVWGLLALGYLMLPNVLAFLRPARDGSVRIAVASRWGLKFFLFVLTAGVCGGGTFDDPAAIWQGAVYFTLLAGVELWRLDDVPGDLARILAPGTDAAASG